MKNYMKIKAMICERQETSRAMHRRIRETKGMDRHELRLEKKRYGVETRHLLLAYAHLRGVPYTCIERHCTHPPSPSAIVDFAMLYGERLFDIEDIKRWLTPPSEEAHP